MKVIRNPQEIYAQIAFARREGASVGLVPTMGALHDGHFSLVRESVSKTDMTVVSIFVNPTQFAPHEDLNRYPRTLDSDLEGLLNERTDFVFIPDADQIYRPGHSTFIEPPQLAIPLEGQFRPTHFRGVATVVLKLFNIIPASVAFFGQKDFQQLMVIRKMVEDLDVPIRIEACPTYRETDGLAMSSRNRYLNNDERIIARGLSVALNATSASVVGGERSVAVLEREMHQSLNRSGINSIDYARIVDCDTFHDQTEVTDRSVALIAARVGATRLIDNCLLGQS